MLPACQPRQDSKKGTTNALPFARRFAVPRRPGPGHASGERLRGEFGGGGGMRAVLVSAPAVPAAARRCPPPPCRPLPRLRGVTQRLAAPAHKTAPHATATSLAKCTLFVIFLLLLFVHTRAAAADGLPEGSRVVSSAGCTTARREGACRTRMHPRHRPCSTAAWLRNPHVPF